MISSFFRANFALLNICIMLIILSLFAPEHLLLIAFVVLLLFGGKKIPELMKGLGKGIREFNDAKDNVKNHIEESIKDSDPKTKDQEINELRQQVQQLQQKQSQEQPAK
jgi:sec-independent protein translocase protein TatA